VVLGVFYNSFPRGDEEGELEPLNECEKILAPG